MNNWQLFLFVGIAFISVDTIRGSLELSSDELTKLQTLADNECPKVQAAGYETLEKQNSLKSQLSPAGMAMEFCKSAGYNGKC
jgi:hypothetical protein